ncbi:MAG: undecaprenyl-phosphate glucose phosphotransferase [Planctomycetota bacterium]
MKSDNAIIAQRRWSDFVHPLLDSASVMAALAAVRWCTGRDMGILSLAMGLVAVILFLLFSQLTGLQRRGGGASSDREISQTAVTWILTILALAMLGFLTRADQHFSRTVIVCWALVAPALVGLQRMCLRIVQQGLRRRGIGIRSVAIAGHNSLGRQTFLNITNQPALGYRFIGFYDDRETSREEADDSKDALIDQDDDQVTGNLHSLVQAARSGEIDTVLITLPMRAEKRIKFVLDGLSDTTASVYIVPDFFVFELLHSRWTNMGGLPAVSVFENPLFGVDGVSKKVADMAIAFCALIVAAIPMMLIAIAVKLSSPGPIFFRQKRYGLDGREIYVWKFRSMRTCDNGAVVKQATKEDPRITRVGAVLRKTSLDELPQLFNVIEGTMSLVGPRPHATAHNEQYRQLIRGYMLRHKVKPGITGLAQVNGCRGETETLDKMERRIQWDHHYIRTWSIWLDLKILFRTVFVVWKQEQAY